MGEVRVMPQIDLDFAKVCQRKPLVVVMITTLPLVLNVFGFQVEV
jgi:hypothetical protein